MDKGHARAVDFHFFHDPFVVSLENIFFCRLMRFQLKSRTIQMLDFATFKTDEKTLILVRGV